MKLDFGGSTSGRRLTLQNARSPHSHRRGGDSTSFAAPRDLCIKLAFGSVPLLPSFFSVMAEKTQRSELGSFQRDQALPQSGTEERKAEWEAACEPAPAAGALFEVQLAAQTTDDTHGGQHGEADKERKKMCKNEKKKKEANSRRPTSVKRKCQSRL